MTWQKIETAPRDGSIFLGHDAREGVYVSYYLRPLQTFFLLTPAGWLACRPTHWQPLPEPPRDTVD